jgi:hypothetical protein
MKNLNAGSVILLAAVVIVGLVVLGFLGTLLSNIVPLTIVAVVAFILGRTSHTVNYLEMAGKLFRRTASPAVVKSVVSQTVSAVSKAAEEAPTPEPERQKQAETNLADAEPEIKTEQEILAEARLREEEIRKGTTAYDPTAALEERRRRLLGDKTEEE